MLIRHTASPTNANSAERQGTVYVETDDFISDRLILAADQMGYSVHITTLKPGMDKTMCYKEHLETCYCISGTGTITNTKTDEKFDLAAGVLYALNQHDEHHVTSKQGMVMLSIFNPAIAGDQVHRPDGSYGKD